MFGGMTSPSKLAAAAVVVCVAVEGYALADRSRGEPRNHDIRRYVLGEVTDRDRVEQRFLVKEDRFSSVTIHPRPASPAPTGTVVFQLRDVTDQREWGTVTRVSAPLPELARMESFTIHFRPQPSVYREYALDVIVQGGSDGQGIGLLAARDGNMHEDIYRGPALLINGRRRFGNLVFKTTVDSATSNFGSIASQLGQGGIPAPRVVLLLVLIAKYAALFVIIRAFARSVDEATLEARTPPSLPV